jgi:hypothetical protein
LIFSNKLDLKQETLFYYTRFYFFLRVYLVKTLNTKELFPLFTLSFFIKTLTT